MKPPYIPSSQQAVDAMHQRLQEFIDGKVNYLRFRRTESGAVATTFSEHFMAETPTQDSLFDRVFGRV